MNVIYRLIGTLPKKKVKVRIYYKKLNLIANTGLFSTTENWDAELGKFKRNKVSNDDLRKLEIDIENAFNIDYALGKIIDQKWLEAIIKKSFLRPNKEEKMINPVYTIFLSDFGEYWLENHSKTWRNAHSKELTVKERSQKLKAIKQIIAFQDKLGTKIKLSDFTTETITAFYHFLIEEKYLSSTSKKTLADIKFLCKRAKELKFNVCLDFEAKICFKDFSTKTEGVYLNEEEITSIFNYDFSDNEPLESIRDTFILSLWTGLRISDIRNLNATSLKNGIIESVNIKTNNLAKIPLHPQVKHILNKRFGNLPPKVKKDEYNIQIKEICKLCKIDAKILGKLFIAEKKRKVLDYYEKHKLISSHTARRSFATNLSRIVSNHDIMVLGAWKTPEMVTHYNKESKLEIAEKLNAIWSQTKI